MLTATEKIMQKLIHMATGERIDDPGDIREAFSRGDCDEGELREGTHETGLPCDWSRHYETKSVAAEMLDGSWVGWTYFYGGGKHGSPREIPWMEDAYDLTYTLETLVVKRFSKKESS